MRNYRSILKIWNTHFLIFLIPKRIITFHFISKLKYCKKKLLYGELAHPVLWNIWSSPLLVAKQGYFPSKQQSESYQSGLLPGWPACTNGLVWFHFRRALARFPDDCDVYYETLCDQEECCNFPVESSIMNITGIHCNCKLNQCYGVGVLLMSIIR